jgi:hypothetical protein
MNLKISEPPKADLQAVWNKLFTDPTRSTLNIKPKLEIEKTEEEKKMEKEKEKENTVSGAQWTIPKKKTNFYTEKMVGWGSSAYIFDFLDDVLQKEITTAFNKIFQDAKVIIPDLNYKDPYSLENITQMKGTNEELIKKVGSLMSDSNGVSRFDVKCWENSITCGQVNKIIVDWKWNSNKNSPDAGKELVDKYDFNGDGRLNPNEFLLAMIMNNKNLFLDAKCSNCMAGIIKDYILPIYMYLDCSNEEKVNSENIWNNLQKLRRTKTNAFNFYLCDYQNGMYRTSSCNDFIIKARHSMDGYISKSEFVISILQGYWSRHVDKYAIHMNDDLNLKKLRWNEDGSVDKVCNLLKNPPKSP